MNIFLKRYKSQKKITNMLIFDEDAMLLEKFYYLENKTKYFEMACVETHETLVSIERKKRVNSATIFF